MGFTADWDADQIGPDEVFVWVVPLGRTDRRKRRDYAHLAQGQILAKCLHCTPEEIDYTTSASGKPALSGEPFQFNLSHSGTIALLALTRKLPVGIDVQAQHHALKESWFAKRICTPREAQQADADGDPQALLRLWVRKEAVIKARGEGSFLDAGNVDVLDDSVDGGYLCRDLPQPGRFYRAALAVGQASDVSITRIGCFIPEAAPRR